MTAPIALERARIVVPFTLLSVVLALALSEPTGVPVTLPVLVWNGFAITGLTALTIALFRRRVPVRWGHWALAVPWVLATGGTVLSQYQTGTPQMSLLTIAEAAAVAIMIDTRLVIGLLAVLDLVWIPLDARLGGEPGSFYLASMASTQAFTIVFQRLQRNALVRAERERLSHENTAQELAHQLSELRRSEDERARLQDQLLHAQRMESLGTLSSGLAHDMNNVLASITSLAELVRDDPGAPTVHTDLERILAQTGRGAALTRGLLAFSRRTEIKKKPVAIGELIQEVVGLLSRTLPKHVAVDAMVLTDGACVEGDRGQLQQVIVNLGVNAADAMSSTGRIDITCTKAAIDEHGAAELGIAAGDYACIAVIDNGCGMSDETRKRAFEPFFTTKPLGKGTGLGLATVWGITHGHGGTVTVESQPGAGTTFRVYLPLTQASARRHARAPSPVMPDAPATVLVVDDEDAVRATTIRLLQRRGMTVLSAANGEEALATFAAHEAEIALVILDMGMPVMGGRECFEKLRMRSNVPVLVATGYALEEEARAMIAQGAALIEKPFRSEQLLREVARLLQAPNLALHVA